MASCEYIKRIPKSENVIVFIHGIIGTPKHFDFIMDIVPNDWSAYNIVLDGHGAGVKEFGKTSMKKWERQVTSLFNKLRREHKNVYACGHSMGTLLIMDYANSHPCVIKRMFLLAIPLRARLRDPIFANAGAVIRGTKKEDPVAKATFEACGVDHKGAKLWQYISWLPRFWELLLKIEKIRRILPNLRTKGICFQSGKDELVDPRSYKLIKDHPTIKAYLLKDSYHFWHTDEDIIRIRKEFESFCNLG